MSVSATAKRCDTGSCVASGLSLSGVRFRGVPDSHGLLADHDIDVRGTAGDAANAIRLATTELPDVVVLDIRMPPSFTDEGFRAADGTGRCAWQRSTSSLL